MQAIKFMRNWLPIFIILYLLSPISALKMLEIEEVHQKKLLATLPPEKIYIKEPCNCKDDEIQLQATKNKNKNSKKGFFKIKFPKFKKIKMTRFNFGLGKKKSTYGLY